MYVVNVVGVLVNRLLDWDTFSIFGVLGVFPSYKSVQMTNCTLPLYTLYTLLSPIQNLRLWFERD